MKPAGSGGVAEVSHALRLAKNLRPRHFVQVVFERHRMCNELQAFIQTAVRFDVQVFSVGVGDVEQLLRIAVYRTAVIDFKLNAEMPQAFSVEYKVWRVAVFVDNFAVFVPAGRAISVVVAVSVRTVAMNNAAAIIATHIILIKAMLAERVRVVLNDILLIKPLGAVVADYG